MSQCCIANKNCVVQRNMRGSQLSAAPQLLLRHRRQIPPFSSYGGILRRGPQDRAFFLPDRSNARCSQAPGHPPAGCRAAAGCPRGDPCAEKPLRCKTLLSRRTTGGIRLGASNLRLLPGRSRISSQRHEDLLRQAHRRRRATGTSSTPPTRCSAASPAQIALRLRGKHKPIYTPHVDTGDFIVVTNVDKLRVTGNKAEDKLYHRHTGYPGGISHDQLREDAGALPRPRAGEGGQGHAAQGPARLRDDQEAQVLRRRRASALGAAAQDRSTSEPDTNHDRQLLLRHRPPQDVGGARVPQAGHGQDRRQRQAGRRVLLARDRPHGRAPAARADQPRDDVRHHGQRDRRRRVRPGRRGAPRHHARADRLRRAAEADAVEGRARHARRARSRAQEGRPAQGATRKQFSKR